MKKFEPSAKAIALREYVKLYEIRVEEPQEKLTETSWMLLGAEKVFRALGGTDEELATVKAIAWKIKGYENEKALQA